MDEHILNNGLVKAFRDGISPFCYFDGAGGNSIDNMIVNTIKRYNPHISVIELAAWKGICSQDLYSPIRTKVQAVARTEACDCLDLVFARSYDLPLLIRQPNNTQMWPDILIVYKRRGLGIEVKSSKYDQIVWNSGLPRRNGIYIYNGGLFSENETANTTYFLGQHILRPIEQKHLQEAREANHKISRVYNDLLSTSKWSLYARPMFNYTGRFLADEHRVQRETNVLDFILSFSWEDTR